MKLNETIYGSLVLLGGVLFYIYELLQNDFITALITALITVILWTAINLVNDSFSIEPFVKLISYTGLILAVSIFFFFGVEEISYPAGSFVFHAEGIAKALGLGFVSIIPMILFNFDPAPKPVHISPEIPDEPIVEDDNWEIASEADVLSGEFEPE